MYIQRFAPNLKGRDFVCGDLHGSMSCLEQFLLGIDFDVTKDRLFCAGDLVDRGPRNEECLALLYEPWFFSCKGNHEELMISYFRNEPLGLWWGRNGGSWGLHYRDEASDLALFVQSTVEDKLVNLPLLMTVEQRDGSIFHVLHAELISPTPLTDADLADEYTLKQFAEFQVPDGDTILWGRRMFGWLYDVHLNERTLSKFERSCELNKCDLQFSDKLSPIYSGHTCVRNPIRYKGQTILDTRAFESYKSESRPDGLKYKEYCGLTFTEPATGKFWFANDRVFKEIELITVGE